MLIVEEINKMREAIVLTQKLSEVIHKLDSSNPKVKDSLQAKVNDIRSELIASEIALEDLHS